jgi:hypothetical protein
MGGAARTVSDAAADALEAAAKECPSDLRAVWLVVDSSKTGADPAGYLDGWRPHDNGPPLVVPALLPGTDRGLLCLGMKDGS